MHTPNSQFESRIKASGTSKRPGGVVSLLRTVGLAALVCLTSGCKTEAEAERDPIIPQPIADNSDVPENSDITHLPDTSGAANGINPPEIPADRIEFNKGDFDVLVDFITHQGRLVLEKGVPSDHQFTFYDKAGRRHALVVIRRDENKQPSRTAKARQISVWGYFNGKKTGPTNRNNSFSYIITPNHITVYPFDSSRKAAVETGVRELLAKVKTLNESHK